MLLFALKMDTICVVKELLYSKYQILDLGPVQQFLGLQVVQDQQAQAIHIN
jgi:hypothetical protein